MNNNNKQDTVCAVVVTYNRKGLLMECLDALFRQTRPLNAIYLIDNASTDGTPELLKAKGYITELPPDRLDEPWEKTFFVPLNTESTTHIAVNSLTHLPIHYVRMNENTGGTGGFYEGVKRGYERGYDWLWLMDDDAEPLKNSLEKVVAFTGKEGVSALANLLIDSNNEILYQHRGYFNFKDVFKIILPLKAIGNNNLDCIEIDHASFVGILVSKEAIKKIGYPKKEFFIYNDDVEYCIRLRSIGKILLIYNSVIIHRGEGKNNLYRRSVLGTEYLFHSYDKLWLTYYGKRNMIWLGLKYSSNKISFYLKMALFYIRAIAAAIFIHDHKIRRMRFQTCAYLDGIRGIFDNKKPKKILYDK